MFLNFRKKPKSVTTSPLSHNQALQSQKSANRQQYFLLMFFPEHCQNSLKKVVAFWAKRVRALVACWGPSHKEEEEGRPSWCRAFSTVLHAALAERKRRCSLQRVQEKLKHCFKIWNITKGTIFPSFDMWNNTKGPFFLGSTREISQKASFYLDQNTIQLMPDMLFLNVKLCKIEF